MSTVLLIIALLNGGWMVADGLHVLRTGKYIGPVEPGPWSRLLRRVGINPFSMGLPFVILGSAWILTFGLLFGGYASVWSVCLAVALATLWYVPVGTVLSVIAIVLLCW